MQDVFWHSCTKNSKQQQGLEMGFPAAVGTLSDTATDPQKGDKRKGKPNEELQPRGQDGTQRAVCTACLLLTKDFFCSGEAQHSISTSEFLGLLSAACSDSRALHGAAPWGILCCCAHGRAPTLFALHKAPESLKNICSKPRITAEMVLVAPGDCRHLVSLGKGPCGCFLAKSP